MKQTLLIALTLCFSCNAFSQGGQKQTREDPYHLIGKVKSFAETTYSLADADGYPAPSRKGLKIVTFFTEPGDLAEIDIYEQDSLTHIFENIYNPEGYTHIGKNRHKTQTGMSPWVISGTQTYKYTVEKQESSLSGKGTPSLHTYFNKNGRVDSSINYAVAGKINFKSVDKYDSAGQVIETHRYSSNADMSETITYQYDAAGHITLKKWYNAQNVLQGSTLYEYDALGNQTASGELGYNIRRFKYTYADNGNWIKSEEVNKDGRVIYVREREYIYY